MENKRNNELSNILKCNVFKAINYSYYECDEKILKEYLNVNLVSKPMTKEIILSVCQNVLSN